MAHCSEKPKQQAATSNKQAGRQAGREQAGREELVAGIFRQGIFGRQPYSQETEKDRLLRLDSVLSHACDPTRGSADTYI